MAAIFDLDLKQGSTWVVFTPAPEAKALPYTAQECGRYWVGERYFTERQGQANWLMLHTLTGSGTLKIGEENISLQPGTVVIFDCQQKHRYACTPDEDWHFQWVHFSGSAVESTLKLLSLKNAIQLNTTGAVDAQISAHIDSLSELYDRHDIAAMFLVSANISALLAILTGVMYQSHIQGAIDAHRLEIEQALSFMKGHYPEKITLFQLAQNARMSKFHFMKLFKSSTGVSPYSYLTHYRINRSKEMLRSTDLPVAQIGERVGFPDNVNFIREFKKTTGQTPLQYRKKG